MDNTQLTPALLEQELKKKIIGQDVYLHDLSTCIWLHNERRQYFLRTGKKISRPKYNLFVLGKSGMGKSSAIKAAADILGMTLVVEDASELRGAGWKGKQVSDIVYDIAKATLKRNKTLEEADEFAIVVLDEIDKVFEPRAKDRTFSPVANLLKFIEGTEISLGEGEKRMTLSTDNILFIGIGAFDGLDEIIKERMAPKRLGFFTEESSRDLPDKDILKNVTTEDLHTYGVSEQLLGRFPIITVMNELTAADYENILLKSEISPVSELNNLLQKEEGVEISMTPDAAAHMAERITDRGIGARGLQSELVKVLKEPLYHLPDKRDVCEYRVDYRDEIVVDEIVGNRIRTQPRTPAERMVMDQSDRENLGMVSIDYVNEDDISIHLFVDEMFEPFATKSFMGKCGPGLNDCYDYLTIKHAQIFTAAAVIHLFLENKRNKKHKDMCALLSVIRKMPVSATQQTAHPFEKAKNRLLVKLEDCDSDRIKEIRKISWNVARSYGLLLYELDYEQCDFDDGIIT